MTATELYSLYPEFQQLIASWVQDKQCPIGLADWCLEQSQPKLFKIVAEAAEIVRPDIGSIPKSNIGLYPTSARDEWYWYPVDTIYYSHHLKMEYDTGLGPLYHSSVTVAILAYLDESLKLAEYLP